MLDEQSHEDNMVASTNVNSKYTQNVCFRQAGSNYRIPQRNLKGDATPRPSGYEAALRRVP